MFAFVYDHGQFDFQVVRTGTGASFVCAQSGLPAIIRRNGERLLELAGFVDFKESHIILEWPLQILWLARRRGRCVANRD